MVKPAGVVGPITSAVVTLDRVMFHRSEIVEAMRPHLRRSEVRRMADRDAYEIRSMIEGWGKTVRAQLWCPTTWWQHFKLALRMRWPRLFGRLAVRMEHAIAENGAVVAGLTRVMADKLVIPYSTPIAVREYLDDPCATDPEDPEDPEDP